MTHPDSNSAASRHAGSAQDAGFPLYALVLALTAGHTVASTALMVLPAVAPAVAHDYGISAALIGYQFGIVGTGQLATLLLVGFAIGEVPIPPLKARVTDLTSTFTADQRTALEQKLAAFEAQKGSQIAVLLVPTTQPETVEQYAVRVQESWKLGRKGIDDGVLMVVAKNDRKLWIEVGYGLEGSLTDATTKRIVEEEACSHSHWIGRTLTDFCRRS